MTYTVSSYHLGKQINLAKVIRELDFEIVKNEDSYVLFKKDEVSYVYIKFYGSIAFCNFEKKEIQSILKQISNIFFNDLESEDYEIEINENANLDVSFKTVVIPKITTDIVHIVMLNLCQSVALENYQTRTNVLLEQTRSYSDNLSNTGKIGLSRAKLKFILGKTMVLKNRIAENLLIFETSDLAWSREELSGLDSELKNQLDMINRHHGLQYSLNIVKENLDLFSDLLQHKHSSTLEWIIIILILLEVADLIGSKFL